MLCSHPFAPYYRDVRIPRRLAPVLAFSLGLVTACNRGSHPSQLDTPAPDFTVSDGTSTIHLASYRGKVVLLNFWGTWCPPCIEEIPSLIQLHHDMPSLSILSVAVPQDEGVSEDPAEYKAFIARHHIDFTNVRDTNELAPRLFHTDMWPETYAIDRNGVIRRKFVGSQDWTSPEIRSFLKSL
jgi:cytochrome c biogenesis protein CcmG, thiol:disulfide interchange protein DsbE